MSIIKTIATVGSWSMLHRITSLIRDSLQASLLGAGIFADAFSCSFKLANILRKLFSEGSFNASFLPVFVNSLKDSGKTRAELIASQVMTILAIVLTVFLAFSLLGFDYIIQAYAPGVKVGTLKYEHTVAVAKICFPYVAMSFFTALFSGILNGVNKFALPAAIHVLLNIFLICALFIGPLGFESVAYTMAWATFLGGCAQACILYLNVRQSDFRIVFTSSIKNMIPEVKEIFGKMLDGAMGAGILQLNIFLGYVVISYLPSGSFSYVYYTDHLHQVPVGILGTAFSTALLPPLTRAMKDRKIKSVNNQLNYGLLYALLFSLPFAALMICGSQWLTAAVFGGGKFGFEQICNASPALSAFCFGLPPYMIMKVISAVFFANKDTKTTRNASVLSIISNVVCCFLFLPIYQHTAIAVATSLSSCVATVYLLCNLNKISGVSITSNTIIGIFKLLFLTFLSCVGLYYLEFKDPYWWNNLNIFGVYNLDLPQNIIMSINGVCALIIGLVLFYIVGKCLRAFDFLAELKKEQIADSALTEENLEKSKP